MRRVWATAYQDNVFFLASALAFDALLAVLPFVLLALGALGYVVQGQQDALIRVHALLDRFLPLQAEGPMGPAERLLAGVSESRGELSLIGLPLFLWLATRFYGTVRAGLNQIFHSDDSRPWLVGKGVDFTLVLLSLLVLVANTAVGLAVPGNAWAGRLLRRTASVAFGTALFYLVYTIAPTRRIRRDTALVGAAVASLAFEVARVLYGVYLTQFATLDRLVSDANVIALGLFLAWLYYTATVFLVGGEVAETYDLWRRPRE